MSRRGEDKTLKMLERIKEIEREFDEPLSDIVIVMRHQGCKWDTIAGALDISYNTLLNWRKKFGFARPMPNFAIHEETCGRKSIKEKLAREHGYNSFRELYQDLRISKGMLVSEIAHKLGVHEDTISQWTPEELKGIYVFTENKRRTALENFEKARAANHRIELILGKNRHVSRARDLHKGES